ncbi:MAG TPA: PilZ domain-containing protein [Vicinamibacterales bacterium]|nr:PilZ domain-containing protein [Vicinamibacterales bacterium]
MQPHTFAPVAVASTDSARPSTSAVEHRSDAKDNRRVWQRIDADTLPPFAVQLNGRLPVRLIDLSRGGARLAGEHRLLPGATVSVRLESPDGTILVRGHVVRSRLVKQPDGTLGYEAGIAFDQPIDNIGGHQPEPVSVTAVVAQRSEEVIDVLDGNDW